MTHSIIIAGGRDFHDYYLAELEFIRLTKKIPFSDILIISGGALGADAIGEDIAKNLGTGLKIFPADWNQFGKSAGYKRNIEMAENATELLAFWNGISKGTGHMIDIAKRFNLNITVIRY